MEDISRLCMVCMSIKDENNICPACKCDTVASQEAGLLPLKCVVAGRYCIGKAIKRNSEGATYPAYDLRLNRAVSIREFFPDSLAYRAVDGVSVVPAAGSEEQFEDCLSSFIELWSKLVRLKGLSALISVYDIVEENSTAYAVYEESEFLTLRNYLLKTDTGYISWDRARILFMPILSTLGTLHTSGIIHRGISPSAFIFSTDGKLKLTDFCIEQVRTVDGGVDAEIIDGYAPLEQYTDSKPQGAWTDVYSFAAVLYRTLIGTTPISAPERARNDQMMIPAKFAEQLPPYVINSLINAMQIEPEDRTRNVEQLRSNLSASPRAVSASASVYAKTPVAHTAASTVKPQTSYVPPRQATSSVPPRTPASSGTVPSERKRGYVEELHDAPSEKYDRAAAAAYLAASEKKDKSRKKLMALLIVMLVILVGGIILVASELPSIRGNESESTTSNVFTVPSFLGMTYEQALQQYSSVLTIERAESNSDTLPAGSVMAQSIPNGTVVTTGNKITLTVSMGSGAVEIPNVVGLTQSAAIQVLNASGFTNIATGKKYNDGTHTAGTVAEIIHEGSSNAVKTDALITLSIYSDAEATTSPQTAAEGETLQ